MDPLRVPVKHGSKTYNPSHCFGHSVVDVGLIPLPNTNGIRLEVQTPF